VARQQESDPGDHPQQPIAPADSSGSDASVRGGLGKTLFRMRLALTRVLSNEARVEPSGEAAGDPAEPSPALPARESARANGAAGGDEHLEFSELLGALGAEPSDTSDLERKEREIAELQRNLEMLRPIGDELARVEQQRLAEKAEHEREVAELREQITLGRSSQEAVVARQIETVLSNIAELQATGSETVQLPESVPPVAVTPSREGEDASRATERNKIVELEQALEESRAEVCRLSGCLAELSETLSKRNKALERSQDSLESLRARFEERKRLASERWHELRGLKKRLRELEREGGGAPGTAA
jgi:Skp family chaperone for outer membrane proteins